VKGVLGPRAGQQIGPRRLTGRIAWLLIQTSLRPITIFRRTARRLAPHRHCRTESGPGELVVPHPLKIDGRDCTRAATRAAPRTVVATRDGRSIRSRHVNEIDIMHSDYQHFGQISTQGKRALGWDHTVT